MASDYASMRMKLFNLYLEFRFQSYFKNKESHKSEKSKRSTMTVYFRYNTKREMSKY